MERERGMAMPFVVAALALVALACLAFWSTIQTGAAPPVAMGITETPTETTAPGATDTPTPTPGPTDTPTPTPWPPACAEPLCVWKVDLLVDDLAHDGQVSVGDTVEYVVLIQSNLAATAAFTFTDQIPAGTTLVLGSVSASPTGTVVGEIPIIVTGSIPSGGEVTVRFRVVVQPGAERICNFGLVAVRCDSGPCVGDEPTDDPNTPVDDDWTCTDIRGPAMTATPSPTLSPTPTQTPTRTPTRTPTPAPTATHIPNRAPQVPGFDVWCGRSDPGEKVELVTVVEDPDGFADLKLVYFIINTAPSYTNGVGMAYNRQVNKMSLRNDAGTAWIVGGAPGTGGDLNTSRATLHVAESSAAEVDGRLVVKWKVTFKAPFAGRAYNLFVVGVDYTGLHSGWQNIGAWGVGTVGHPPCVGAVNPPSGASAAGEVTHITTQFGDPDGVGNLKIVYMLVAQSPSVSGNAVYLAYNRDVNKIFLRNDANTAWLGGYAPGSPNVIENSRVIVDVADCAAVSTATTLVADWALRFKPAFAGWRYVYVSALDDDGHYAAWQRKGYWDITLP